MIFFNLYKIWWKKYFTYPLRIFFNFLLPVIWILAFIFLYNDKFETQVFNNQELINNINTLNINSILVSDWPTSILLTIPVLLGSYRIDAIYKFFPMMKITKFKFVFSFFCQYLSIFFIVYNIQFFIIVIFFPNNLSFIHYFLNLVIAFSIFSIFFLFSIALSLVSSNNYRNISFASLFYFIVIVFTSGILIPASVIDPSSLENNGINAWFKWIQYLTLAGCGNRLITIIQLPNLINASDILIFISPLIQISIISFIVYKKFKWN